MLECEKNMIELCLKDINLDLPKYDKYDEFKYKTDIYLESYIRKYIKDNKIVAYRTFNDFNEVIRTIFLDVDEFLSKIIIHSEMYQINNFKFGIMQNISYFKCGYKIDNNFKLNNDIITDESDKYCIYSFDNYLDSNTISFASFNNSYYIHRDYDNLKLKREYKRKEINDKLISIDSYYKDEILNKKIIKISKDNKKYKKYYLNNKKILLIFDKDYLVDWKI